MLLDDVINENINEMRDEINTQKNTKEYLKNINIDSVGEATKKAVKTEFGYTIALSAIGGTGFSIWFHSFAPMVFGLVSGVVTYSVLTIAERTKMISFQD